MARRPKPQKPPFRLSDWSESLVAALALTVSLITILTGAWFAMRGSVVVALPPDSVFFYRDSADRGAVLTAGVDTALVNTASANYGDVVTRITLEIDTPAAVDPRFDYETLVTPVFTEDAIGQAENCPVQARCVVAARQFLAIEEPRRTLDVPGGSSRSDYVGFVLHRSNCAVAGACDAFVDAEAAAAELDKARMLTLRFYYRLHSDGEKVAVCRASLRPPGQPDEPWVAAHLLARGWLALNCEREDA